MSEGSKPRLLVTRRLPEPVEARLAAGFDAQFNRADRAMTRDELNAAMGAFDAIAATITDRIDAGMIGAAGRRVRMIANYGAGTDHLDLRASKGAGIVVSNTPDALTEATAEIAVLLMLMAARRAGEGERELRAGRWTGWRPTHLVGQGLNGKVLGLVGFGRIAQATAQRAEGLGMRVTFHSRSDTDDPRRRPDLATLAAEADVLSLHVPGGPATHHLVDAALLARMRPGAILINTARGSVVDEAALIDALAGGRIAAAGLDVYPNEPAINPGLLALENVVLLPHLGSATTEARVAMGMQLCHNLERFFAGEAPPDRVA